MLTSECTWLTPLYDCGIGHCYSKTSDYQNIRYDGYDMTANENLFAGGSAEYRIFSEITGQSGGSFTEEDENGVCSLNENDGRSIFAAVKLPLTTDEIVICSGNYAWEISGYFCGTEAYSGSGNYKGYYGFRDTYHIWDGEHPGAVFSDNIMAQVYFDQTVTFEKDIIGAYYSGFMDISALYASPNCSRSSHIVAACDYYEGGTAGHNPAAQTRTPCFEAAVSELLGYAADEETYDECDPFYGDFYVRIYE